MTEQCSNCRYYMAVEDDGSPLSGASMGLCKRHAPALDEGTADAVWPITYPSEWCGEYSEAAWEPPGHTISIPEAGARFYGLSRNGSYKAAQRGEIPAMRVGHKLRVSVAAMKRIVGA